MKRRLCPFMKRNPRYVHWQIAYRKKGEDVFRAVANPPYAWAADPFLVEYEGRVLLFAELFLFKSERNGVIGCCEYAHGGFGGWTVAMDEHWHLSYPNVFVEGGKLRMCPESCQKHEIGIYEMAEFPDKWVQKETLMANVECVDTTFLKHGGSEYLFTFRPDFRDDGGALLMFKRQGDGSYGGCAVVTEDKRVARPGGNFVKAGGRLYRVSQDCGNSYGEAVMISEVVSVEPEYKERVVRRVSARDIRIDTRKEVLGVHTYNRLKGLEVVDFKYYAPSPSEALAARRTKKVFTNKY